MNNSRRLIHRFLIGMSNPSPLSEAIPVGQLSEAVSLSQLSDALLRSGYGCLSKDCWTLVGNHCSLVTKIKIAFTCSKLRNHYDQQFDLPAKFAIIKKNVVDHFIKEREMGWDWGLRDAAKGGHRDLVDFFIEKGATDWNAGLWSAAIGGYRDLVDFFILKCEDAGHAINWNWAIWGASQNKDSTVCHSLVDFFISKNPAVDMEWGLEGAARGGHRDLIDYFISKGAKDWYWGSQGAANGGHQDLIDFFQAKINS